MLLDGHDIKQLKVRWLRQQIGLVSQEPALFATTIRENMLLGRPDATQIEIEEAARVANAHSFIIKLPDAYDTQVSFYSLVPKWDMNIIITIIHCLSVSITCEIVHFLFFTFLQHKRKTGGVGPFSFEHQQRL